ncbi:hypothetical protein B0H11DRAFT_1627671, partial [Mycena galericulata]
IGDLPARFAELVLQHAQPFPGENDVVIDKRFMIYEISPTEHVIVDSQMLDDAIIPSQHLRDSKFQLGLWYAKQVAHSREIEPNDISNEDRYLIELGDA